MDKQICNNVCNLFILAYFSAHYAAVFCAQLCCSGIGYAISTIFNPKSSQMASVVVVLVMAMLSGQYMKNYLNTSASCGFQLRCLIFSGVTLSLSSNYFGYGHYAIEYVLK